MSQTMPPLRDTPYVWVSWVAALLSGDRNCEWSAWFRSHYRNTKRPTTFDSAAYQVEHTAILTRVRDLQLAEGYSVTIEGQNDFRMRGKTGILSGKPDLIAMKGEAGVITDVKSSLPRASHTAQVMLYMWALPIADQRFHGCKFDGQVVYQTRTLQVLASEIDEQFVQRVGTLLRLICGDTPPARTPSFRECKFCDILPIDCPDYIPDEGLNPEPVTDLF